MSVNQQLDCLRVVDPIITKNDIQLENESVNYNVSDEYSLLLPNFDESNLPERFRAPWDKANAILKLPNQGIVDAPGVSFMKIVASLSEPTNPRTVKYTQIVGWS